MMLGLSALRVSGSWLQELRARGESYSVCAYKLACFGMAMKNEEVFD
jgi:hypothetical protein